MQQLTVLFADLANSTKLYQTEGDTRAHQLISDSLARMQEVVEENNGTLLRTVGDAVLASFNSTEDAFHGAVAIQLAHKSTQMSVRVGFHYGEVIPDKGDLYGNAVNIAARVASFAKAEEIYTTADCIDRLPIALQSRSDFIDRINFKGIDSPLPVHRVYWSNDAAATRVVSQTTSTEQHTVFQYLEIKVNAKRVLLSVENKSLSFGRDLINEFVIDHEATSRSHASIEYVNGRFLLKDHSTNGTYVDRTGRPIDFLRRDEIALEQFGRIGFGWKPTGEDDLRITFRLVLEEGVD